MNHTILNSESFDRAAHSLSHSLDNFSRNSFSEDVARFERAVERMARIAGMQAANSQYPENQPYSADDFFNT